MLNSNGIGLTDDDQRGFARTIAEIEWLLPILVLVYLVAVKQQAESQIAIHMALFFLGAFILALHYAHFYKAAQSALASPASPNMAATAI